MEETNNFGLYKDKKDFDKDYEKFRILFNKDVKEYVDELELKNIHELKMKLKLKFFNDHKEFYKRFPIVGRKFVTQLAYSEISLKKYMLKISNFNFNKLFKEKAKSRRLDY